MNFYGIQPVCLEYDFNDIWAEHLHKLEMERQRLRMANLSVFPRELTMYTMGVDVDEFSEADTEPYQMADDEEVIEHTFNDVDNDEFNRLYWAELNESVGENDFNLTL